MVVVLQDVNRIAVVTGASSGIGRALAGELGRSGHLLHLVGRNASRLLDVSAAAPKGSQTHAVDLADTKEVGQLAYELAKSMQGIDVLVHCAGTFTAGPFDNMAVSDFDRQWHVNVRAPYVITQALLPALRVRRGQVVFVNSSAGVNMQGTRHIAGYAACKHALRALADCLRAEVNIDGIRVLSVYPGRTATAMQEAIHMREGRLYNPEDLLQPDDVVAAVMTALDMPPTAELTDIMLRPMRKPG